MKLLERLKKEWPDFTVLARNVGRFCMRKVRKEDATQEISQIRALLPKTRYLQVATCLSVLFLFYLIRFGCSPSDKPTQFATIGCGRAEQGTMHKKIQLWENGPYWADTNIGATNSNDPGYYFWWGDTVGYMRVGDSWIASCGSNSQFLSDPFDLKYMPTFGKSIDELKYLGWIANNGVLSLSHDAAHVHWGGNWRMPTIEELNELCDKCNWKWTINNGITGFTVRGRGNYASASIFLPAGGQGKGTSLMFADSGYYWSSVPGKDKDWGAWGLYFSSDYLSWDYSNRYFWRPVRPVQSFRK